MRAEWSQKDEFTKIGWPILTPEAQANLASEPGAMFQEVAQGLMVAIFRGAPVAEVFSLIRQVGGRAEDKEADQNLMAEAAKIIGPYQNWDTTFESKGGFLEDALRLKSGSSTGLAVQSGAYEQLGTPTSQDDLDYGAYAALIESELERLVTGNCQEHLTSMSRIIRASLKLDFYENKKIHGPAKGMGSRLIYASCVVRNGIMRSLLCRIFERTVQAGLTEFGSISDGFTEVETPNGKVGVTLVNAQPVTATLIGQLCNEAAEICKARKLKALVMCAGDSIYALIP